MKTHHIAAAFVFLLAGGAAPAAEHQGAALSTTSGRVGVYDSRVVAYAHFWSEPVKKQRDDLVARAQAAKNAGDTATLKELEQQIVADQKRIHLQVFNAAPAVEAMAALDPKLPALQNELRVDRLVSKWDAPALKDIPASSRVDVTDRMMREIFTPSEKQRKVIESLQAGKPLPH